MTDKPWEHEPDHAMFMSEAGFVCEIKRGPWGALNGYIYIPEGHPDFGKSYDAFYNEGDAAPVVHGGWTYSHTENDATIFGFDCAHAGDYAPRPAYKAFDGDTYKDWAYVVNQLERAAQQFKKRSNRHAE